MLPMKALNYNLGIITLTDDVKIFPVDGQHRVAGIKKAIEDKPEMKSERVPVIFVGHSTDEIGMQRTRRMFSTLNRYAKPVSLRDITHRTTESGQLLDGRRTPASRTASKLSGRFCPNQKLMQLF